MNRTVWFAAGAGAGLYAAFRGRRAAESLTLDGISDRINAAALGVRMFREEVAQGAAEKETELRGRLDAAPPGRHQLSSTTTDAASTNTSSTDKSSTDRSSTARSSADGSSTDRSSTDTSREESSS